ncbi:MAG: cobalamin-binding protein [Planctomycetaceae bacterium]|jgi:5-methyltetrahydrofolate--homocysteine methyltransferase|nr:cobalamin-binding protein [Planctomycetaceae bacterium]MBP60896.1 cobalamin-binding protein [Planctomycetaceae bacterium]
MSILNKGLEEELNWLTRPDEKSRIREILANADALMQDISYNLIVGGQDEVDRLTKQALDKGTPASTILDDGLISGMSIVGAKFRDNVIFVPEVLVAARAMKAGMARLEPILVASGIKPTGTVIMGTVKGDLHDIGKNLCNMMLSGAGFSVHDIGVDTKPEEFVAAAREHDAQIVGMSALLTTTMVNIETTIQAFERAGLRRKIKFMAGGAALTQALAEEMGADGYGKDAITCVEKAKEFLGIDDAGPTTPADR